MTHEIAERAVKLLQKEFLLWLEEYQAEDVDAVVFNKIRRAIFRGTFNAFRLGVIGLVARPEEEEYPGQGYLPMFLPHRLFTVDPFTSAYQFHSELPERYFHVMLQAYRLGALVSAPRSLAEVA
jgi:hypothetical protein